MRNAIQFTIEEQSTIVITTDNSGSIGMKKLDAVTVPYDIVSYYNFRVAVMECLATGAVPFSVVLHNFCGEAQWQTLQSGIKRGLQEIGMEGLHITGSSESNFDLVQSAIGLNVIGLRSSGKIEKVIQPGHKMALVGRPLVGEEVLLQSELIAPLSLFHTLSKLDNTIVWPIGSKGILFELQRIDPAIELSTIHLTGVDLHKSAGPSTCFLVSYPDHMEEEMMRILGKWYCPIR